jgi:hypothetical protein
MTTTKPALTKTKYAAGIQYTGRHVQVTVSRLPQDIAWKLDREAWVVETWERDADGRPYCSDADGLDVYGEDRREMRDQVRGIVRRHLKAARKAERRAARGHTPPGPAGTGRPGRWG